MQWKARDLLFLHAQRFSRQSDQSLRMTIVTRRLCLQWSKRSNAPYPPSSSDPDPAKRIGAESEEIPTRVQFSAKPETERRREFLSCVSLTKKIRIRSCYAATVFKIISFLYGLLQGVLLTYTKFPIQVCVCISKMVLR